MVIWAKVVAVELLRSKQISDYVLKVDPTTLADILDEYVGEKKSRMPPKFLT